MSDLITTCLFVGESIVVDPLVHRSIERVLPEDQRELNLEVLRWPERSLDDLRLALRQVPMFGGRRCVWLRGFAVDRKKQAGEAGEDLEDGEDTGERGKGRPSSKPAADQLLEIVESELRDGVFFLLTAPSLDRRSRLYKWFASKKAVRDKRVAADRNGRVNPAQLGELVRARVVAAGLAEPGSAVVQAIAERSGTVLGETLQEVDRICLALGEGEALTVGVVRDTMRNMGSAWIFDFTDALNARRGDRARQYFRELVEGGDHPLRLVATLSGHFARLWAAWEVMPPGGPPGGNVKSYTSKGYNDLPEWFRSKHSPGRAFYLLRDAAGFERGRLAKIHGELLRFDRSLKGSGIAPDDLFEAFLAAVCAPDARGRRLR